MILIFAAVFIWMIVILFSDSFELKYLLMILPTNALSLMAIFHYFKGVKEGVKRLTRVEESSIAKKLSRYGDFKNICKLLINEQNINKKFISNGVIFSEKFVMILPPLVAISIDEICHVYKKVTKQNYQIVSQQLVIVDVHNDYIYINWDDKESMLIIEYLANKNQNIKIGY